MRDTSSPLITSRLWTVYFCITPFGNSGALHETMADVSPLVTAFMSAGALGTVIKNLHITPAYLILLLSKLS